MARKEYEKQLQSLQEELTEMGCLCAQSVQMAVQGISTGDESLTEKILETGKTVDQNERDIESLCLKLLLEQQPVASDLRRISSALKMIYDLNRISEQAGDIAEISRFAVLGNEKISDDLHTMSGQVVKMVNESINAFIQSDLNLAYEVKGWDDEVDEWFIRIMKDLTGAIAKDSEKGEYYLELLMAAKYLEKIGDHATNVAEWAVYSILGHHSREDSQPEK